MPTSVAAAMGTQHSLQDLFRSWHSLAVWEDHQRIDQCYRGDYCAKPNAINLYKPTIRDDIYHPFADGLLFSLRQWIDFPGKLFTGNDGNHDFPMEICRLNL